MRQQLDSFDEFVQNTMQELVDDSGDIRVSPELQHLVGYDEENFDDMAASQTKEVFEISFGQVYLSKPTTVEKDGTVTNGSLPSILFHVFWASFVHILCFPFVSQPTPNPPLSPPT